jgi:hypothetical protein
VDVPPLVVELPDIARFCDEALAVAWGLGQTPALETLQQDIPHLAARIPLLNCLTTLLY